MRVENYGIDHKGEHARDVNEDKFKKIWDRISGRTLDLIGRDKNLGPDVLDKARFLLKDPKFKQERRGIWDQQTREGRAVDDPEAQERVWAVGLAEAIKNRIAN